MCIFLHRAFIKHILGKKINLDFENHSKTHQHFQNQCKFSINFFRMLALHYWKDDAEELRT